jgi:hypothetical protein
MWTFVTRWTPTKEVYNDISVYININHPKFSTLIEQNEYLNKLLVHFVQLCKTVARVREYLIDYQPSKSDYITSLKQDTIKLEGEIIDIRPAKELFNAMFNAIPQSIYKAKGLEHINNEGDIRLDTAFDKNTRQLTWISFRVLNPENLIIGENSSFRVNLDKFRSLFTRSLPKRRTYSEFYDVYHLIKHHEEWISDALCDIFNHCGLDILFEIAEQNGGKGRGWNTGTKTLKTPTKEKESSTSKVTKAKSVTAKPKKSSAKPKQL